MARWSIVGSGSYMPISYHIEKQEETCLFEPPDMMDNYFRRTLMDRRPEKPMYEIDAPTSSKESAAQLNRRYGASGGGRAADLPYLPDGSNTSFEFMVPDTRGPTENPHFEHMRPQMECRYKLHSFQPTVDNSIPSAGVHERTVMRLIRSGMEGLKNRLRWFKESKDGMLRGGAFGSARHKPKSKCRPIADGVRQEVVDQMCFNGTGAYNRKYNETHIGWRSTGDQDPDVARYSSNRASMGMGTQDYEVNRGNMELGHDIQKSTTHANMIGMVLDMANYAEQRKTSLAQGDGQFAASTEGFVGHHGNPHVPGAPRDAVRSGPTAANQMVMAPGLHNLVRGHVQQMGNAVINPQVVSFMASANRAAGPAEVGDLRDAIVASGVQATTQHQAANYAAGPATGLDTLRWDTHLDFKRGEHRQVANYSQMARPADYAAAAHNADVDLYGEEKLTIKRRMQHNNQRAERSAVHHQANFGDSAAIAFHSGPFKKKYLRDATFYDRPDGGIGETEMRN